jgi:hypothetical protein
MLFGFEVLAVHMKKGVGWTKCAGQTTCYFAGVKETLKQQVPVVECM